MSCTQCKISQVLLHSCIQIISLKQTPLAVSLNDFLHMQDEKKRIFIVEESKKKTKTRYPFKARSDSHFARGPALN